MAWMFQYYSTECHTFGRLVAVLFVSNVGYV